MTAAKVVLAGNPEAAAALGSALGDRAVSTVILSPADLESALVGAEESLASEHPDAAVAVGVGEAAMALAIGAAKANVPLAQAGTVPGGNAHAIGNLAGLDAGDDPARAADLIAAWLAEGPSAQNLD